MNNNEKKKIKKDMLFGDITESERKEAIQKIMDSSCPRKSFFVMTTAAAIISTIGILEDNSAVIIGGMLVAPLLSPILAISMGVVMADFRLIYRSINAVLKAVIFAFFFSIFFAFMFVRPLELNHEMMIRGEINLEAVVLSLVVGIVAALSVVRRELQQYLVGTAIAISLIPLISMSAVAIRMYDPGLSFRSLALFLFNLVGIVFSATLIFSLSRFFVSHKEVEKELKEEDELLGNSEGKKGQN